jgi:hypothetical protein
MASFSLTASGVDTTILSSEHVDFDETKRKDKLEIAGVEYIRAGSLAYLKERRPKKSSVWRFGEKVVCARDKKESYYCYRCES